MSNNNQKGVVLITLLLVLLVFAVAGYIVFNYSNLGSKQERSTNTPSDSNSLSPTATLIPVDKTISCGEGQAKIVGDLCEFTQIACEIQGVAPSIKLKYPKNWNIFLSGGPGASKLELLEDNESIMSLYTQSKNWTLEEVYTMLDDKNSKIYAQHFYVLEPKTTIITKEYVTIGDKEGINLTTKTDYYNETNVLERVFLFKPLGYDSIIKVIIPLSQDEKYRDEIEHIIESIQYLNELNSDC